MMWFTVSVNFGDGSVEQDEMVRMISHVEDFIPQPCSLETRVTDQTGIATAIPSTRSQECLGILEWDELLFVGDLRIDNRAELMRDLVNEPVEMMPDEELLLRLYKRSDRGWLKRIYGEFAFLIVDRRKKTWLAARDQMGIKTLFWVQKGERVWLASDIFLLQDVFTTQDLNRDYFQEFYWQDGLVDTLHTPFREVNRVPSACCLIMEDGVLRLDNYWDLSEIGEELIYASDEDYTEQFYELLKEAVRCRIAKQGPTAVMMSGGLDSTSIFALAKQVERNEHLGTIFPVCGVFDELQECDERQYIRPLLDMYQAEAYYEVCDNHGVFKGFPNDAPWTFEPFVPAVAHAFSCGIIKCARKHGAVRILTGSAGDHFMSGTPGIIADLIRQFKYGEAIKHAKSFAYLSRGSMLNILWHYGVAPFLNQGLIKEITYNRNQNFIKKIKNIPSVRQKEFYRQWTATKNRLYTDRVIGPTVGIEMQHPMQDRRFVEFLYRIPGDKLWSHGIRKAILYKAMKNDLPMEILERCNKTEHVRLTYRGLVESWPQLFPILSKGRITQFGWISREEWVQELTLWRQGKGNREDIFLLTTLEIWLYRLEGRGAPLLYARSNFSR